MQAIEFETIAYNGAITIPKKYKNFFGKSVKVILLEQENNILPNKESKVNSKVHDFFEKIQIDLS